MIAYTFAPLDATTAVVVTDAEGEVVDEGTTDADGTYTVDLDPGIYLATTALDPWTRIVAAPRSPATRGSISHVELSWAGASFEDDPEVINAGGGPVIDYALGEMSDNGGPGFIGIRSLSLPLGIYFVSWGGTVGPEEVPDPGDPVQYGAWKISWDNSAADLGQSAYTAAVVDLEAPFVVGSLRPATASMVAPIVDAEDALSIEVDSPYGGINDTFTAYLAITKLGEA